MPAPVQSGDHDIFISYAHQGDTSSRESVAVFVKRLHDELEAEFSDRFGRQSHPFIIPHSAFVISSHLLAS